MCIRDRDWYDVIGEKTIADAVLDRIVHHSLRVELFGESIRKRKSKSENAYGDVYKRQGISAGSSGRSIASDLF